VHARDDRSFGDLLRELSSETSELIRKEIALARTEMSENASRLGAALGAVLLGGAVAFAGVLAILDAVMRGVSSLLAQFLSVEVAVWLGPLLVGLVLAGIGYSMTSKALERVRRFNLKPEKTTQSLQENKEWIKAKIK
jgi:hypothetical protein